MEKTCMITYETKYIITIHKLKLKIGKREKEAVNTGYSIRTKSRNYK
jgi:hypothetical protein